MISVGVQTEGMSPSYTKRMAMDAIRRANGAERLGVVADIGGGRGELTQILSPICERLFLLDYSPPQAGDLPANSTPIQIDLNGTWPLGNETIDFAFSLEVIEHLENPRHFFREMRRILKPSGSAFVTTPNNHSLGSVVTFLLRGQHRLFQEPSYPAHITPILKCDFERIAGENELKVIDWFYSNHDTIPRLGIRLPFGGRLFSDVFGILLTKAEAGNHGIPKPAGGNSQPMLLA